MFLKISLQNSLFFGYIILFAIKGFAHYIDVTGVKCKNLDPTYTNFTTCTNVRKSRWISETTINMTVSEEIFKIIGKIGLFKRSNGKFNPYVFKELNVDGCKFLANRLKFPMVDYLYKQLEKYTNLNTTCPLNPYISVNRMRVDMEKLKWIPLANGDYAIFTHWYVSGKERFAIDFFFTYRED